MKSPRWTLGVAAIVGAVALLAPQVATSAPADPVTHQEFCAWVVPANAPSWCAPPTTIPPAGPTFTAVVASPSSATVSWANVTPSKLGRDGSDSTGFGPWDTDTLGFGGVPKGVTSFTFTGMLPGVTYTFTATTPAGPLTAKVTMPGAVVTPPPAGVRTLGAGLLQFNERSDADLFAQASGAAVDIVHIGVSSSDCSGGAFFLPDRNLSSWLKENPNRRVVSNWNLESGALQDFGAYQAAATCYANLLTNAGLASQVIVRPGYEPNADWMPWGSLAPGNASGDAYRALWRSFAPIFHAHGIKLDWSVNPGPTSGALDPATWWPGDDLSYRPDYATMDQYDWFMGSPAGPARFAEFLNANGGHGLPWLRDFAGAHGVHWGVDETAVVSTSCSGIGDDPQWMSALLNWMNDGGASWILYENVGDGGVCTDLGQNPQTLAAWGSFFASRPVWAG